MIDIKKLSNPQPPVQSEPPQLPAVVPPRKRRFLRSGVLQGSAAAGVLLAVVVFTCERTAPYPYKPSTMLGAYGGNQESAHILTALEATRAQFAMQQQETARAQQEVISVQAANERLSRAYDALYQRGNGYAQAWATTAAQALVLDFQNRVKGLEGKTEVASTMDSLSALCQIGTLLFQTPDCAAAMGKGAEERRDATSNELIGNYRRQSREIAKSLRDWSEGLPDPAELMVELGKAQAQILNAAPRRPAPPSPVYSPAS